MKLDQHISTVKTIGLLPLIWMICSISLTGQVSSTKKQGEKPNIILIYADDLGKGLLSHEGEQIISTPHIDRLVHEGKRFTRIRLYI